MLDIQIYTLDINKQIGPVPIKRAVPAGTPRFYQIKAALSGDWKNKMATNVPSNENVKAQD
jgi:hypothetical protein